MLATEEPASVRHTTGASVPITPVASVISASCAGGATPRPDVPSGRLVSPPFPSAMLENLDRAMPSPVLPSALDQMLHGYGVGKRKLSVKGGFSAGFEIGCLSLPVQKDKGVKNMRSAFEYPQVIDIKLAKEVALDQVLGPFDTQPTNPAYRISPLVPFSTQENPRGI